MRVLASAAIPTADAAASAATLNTENPWPGLLPFSEADKDFFKGRRPETEELLRLVTRERLTVLFGLSGLGKSSLLQAGLFPALREENEFFPVYIRLDLTEDGPVFANQVLQTLVTEAAERNIEAPPVQSGDTLWEYFHRRDAEFWRRNRLIAPVLVFDQFEEVFTVGQANQSRADAVQAFLKQLADLAEGRPPASVQARLNRHSFEAESFSFRRHAYKILLSIREDFVAELEELRPAMPAVVLNRMRLGRMKGDAAYLAVSQAENLIDPPVAHQVVRFVAASKDPALALAQLDIEPALLSVVCRELNNKRAKDGKITADLLEGNQDKILEDFYERCLADVPRPVRIYVEDALLTKSGFRDSDALENAEHTRGVTREAIDRLVSRRLLRIEDRNGERLELSHDRLTGVVAASRDRRHEREKWKRVVVGGVVGILLLVVVSGAGFFLAHNANQAKEAEADATIAKLASLAANQRAEQDRQAKHASDKAAADALANAKEDQALREAAQQATVAAKTAESEAEKQKSSAEAASKEAKTQTGIAIAARDKLQQNVGLLNDQIKQTEDAQKRADDANKARQKMEEDQQHTRDAQNDVRQAGYLVSTGQDRLALTYLARALQHNKSSMAAKSFILDFLMRGDVAVPADFFPNGSRRRFYDLAPISVSPWPGARVFAAAFSPDGKIAAGMDDGVPRLWDGANLHNFGGPSDKHQGIVNSVAFSRDGRLLVTASQDDTAKVWDVSSGGLLATLPPNPAEKRAPMMSAVFDSTGKRVLTASWDKTAVIWDWQSKQKTQVFQSEQVQDRRPMSSAAFSPDDKHIVTASWDRTAVIWDAATAKPEAILRVGARVYAVSFSPNGRYVITGAEDGTAQVWEWKEAHPVGATLRHNGPVIAVAFSKDNRRVVTAAGNAAQVWEVETGTPIGLPLAHQKQIDSVAFDVDSLRVITSSNDPSVRVWEVRCQVPDDDSPLLASLAEAISGYSVADLPASKDLPNRQQVMDGLRDRARAATQRWLSPSK